MNQELLLLITTAASIGFLHTLTGPDHYLPFTVIAKAKKWNRARTIGFTALCGLGHVGSSVILGLIGIAAGLAVHKMELWEGMRGSIISYIFTVFGLLYFIWGMKRGWQNKPHTHLHFHGDGTYHTHGRRDAHAAVQETGNNINLTPWILFTIFVFGPCEPLIPLVMYPAAENNGWHLLIVILVFASVTILTMIVMVLLLSSGFRLMPVKFLERYSHAIAGGTILLCGLGMIFLGL